MKLYIVLFLFLYTTHLSLAVNPWEPQEKVNDKNWLKTHESFVERTKEHKSEIKVVFLGASIVHNWLVDGKPIWDMYYANRSAYNYGIGGDMTQNVLWRIQNHEMDGLNPKVVVLQIGKNNIYKSGPSEADIAHGVTEIIKQLRAKLPDSKIISIGLTPLNSTSDEAKVKHINELLVKNADENNVFFLDIGPHLVDTNGKQKPGLFKDGLHFTLEGYKIWHEAMKPLFEKLYE